MANTKKNNALKVSETESLNIAQSQLERTSIEGLDAVFVEQPVDISNVASPKQVLDVPAFAPPKQVLEAGSVMVSKEQLVSVLENFVSLIKSESNLDLNNNVSVITFDDQATKIDNMKNLLLDAKQTIIELLEERVNDKAKIASLEAQVRFYPDLQAQADLALSVAANNNETKLEISQVKCELEKFRLLRIRAELDKAKSSIWGRIKTWWLS